jgi:exodeoxyribonuclease V alpha subunit
VVNEHRGVAAVIQDHVGPGLGARLDYLAARKVLPPALAARLASTEASTIHRLLGWQSRSTSRFRHDAAHPLPHDIVIVDETSMVSLPLMAKLLDAVRPDAQLVLFGDPGQLASVEAGSVLGDVSGPGLAVDGARVERPGPLTGVVSALVHSRRFPPGSPLDMFAQAIRVGDADAALAVLGDPDSAMAPAGALSWQRTAADTDAGVDLIRSVALPAAERVADAVLQEAA